MNNPSRKQREFERREEEILNAALELFQRDDWEAVTIDEIAQQAQIGKGTVYKHFRSKPELYARLALGFYHRMLVHLQRLNADLPFVERMRESLREVFRFHLDHPEYRNVTQYCERVDIRANLAPEVIAQFDALDAAFDRFSEQALQEAVESGILPAAPSCRQTLGIRATFSGAFAFLWTGNVSHVLDNDALVEQIIAFMLAGLLHQHQFVTPEDRGIDP